MLHGEVLPSKRVEAGPSGGVHLLDGDKVLMWLPAVTMTVQKCGSTDGLISVRLCKGTECNVDSCNACDSANDSVRLRYTLHFLIDEMT